MPSVATYWFIHLSLLRKRVIKVLGLRRWGGGTSFCDNPTLYSCNLLIRDKDICTQAYEIITLQNKLLNNITYFKVLIIKCKFNISK